VAPRTDRLANWQLFAPRWRVPGGRTDAVCARHLSRPALSTFPGQTNVATARVAHVAPIVQWSPRTERPRSKVPRGIKSGGRRRAGQLWGVHRGSDGQGQLPASAPVLEGCRQIVAGGMGQGLGTARPIPRANRAVGSPFAASEKESEKSNLAIQNWRSEALSRCQGCPSAPRPIRR
jgi:hypothetical protein